MVEDPVNGKLTLFNGGKVGGRDTVLVYVFPDLGPTFVSVGKVIKSGGKYTLDFNIPPIKTLPNAPDASVTSVKTNTPRKSIKKGKRKHYLIIAPRKCSKAWKGLGRSTSRPARRRRSTSRRSASADRLIRRTHYEPARCPSGPVAFRGRKLVVFLVSGVAGAVAARVARAARVKPPESSEPRPRPRPRPLSSSPLRGTSAVGVAPVPAGA